MITKKHVESNRRARSVYCLPISKLDTGCAGLCALVTSENSIEKSLASSKIVYSFSVLVHGTPGEEWRSGAYVKVPTNSLRLWKRQKTNLEEINDTNADSQNPALGTSSDPVLLSTVELDLDDALFIRLKESFQFGSGEENSITTLTVQSRHDDGRLANVISYVLRKLGYPVVNDRFAKREFSSLPRRMKNLLKQKICIGCYCICVDFEGSNTTVSMDSHKRTQSSYWREILSS